MSRGLQGSMQCPVLLSIFINDLDYGAEYTLSKFADATKLEEVADRTDGRAAIQRDFKRLEKQAGRNLMKFSKKKCTVLHLGRNNPVQQYMLGTTQLESSLEGKDLEVLVDKKLNIG